MIMDIVYYDNNIRKFESVYTPGAPIEPTHKTKIIHKAVCLITVNDLKLKVITNKIISLLNILFAIFVCYIYYYGMFLQLIFTSSSGLSFKKEPALVIMAHG